MLFGKTLGKQSKQVLLQNMSFNPSGNWGKEVIFVLEQPNLTRLDGSLSGNDVTNVLEQINSLIVSGRAVGNCHKGIL
jgi:hypothetical protein